MEFELIELPELQYNKVHFYTIKKEGAKKPEFKDFLDRMLVLGNDNPRILEDLKQIRAEIKAIGTKFFAENHRFKKEGKAYALATHYPKRKEMDGIYGLRLYCVIVSKEIVILVNGGDKTKKKAKDCPNVTMKFHDANHLDSRIREYIKEQSLKIVGPFLEVEKNEVLYW